MSEMKLRSFDTVSQDLNPQDLVEAFAAVCRTTLDVIGGSRASTGEKQRFLADMATLVATVDGKAYQPKTRDRDVLTELDELDAILDRVSDRLSVEFGSMPDALNELDNPISHIAWMKNCSAGCKVTIEELRQRIYRSSNVSRQRFQ